MLENTYAELDALHSDLLKSAASDFVEKPIGDLRLQLENAIVRDAENRRDSAYRVRDDIMRSLWRLDDSHHPIANDKCFCGAASSRCEVAIAIEPITERLFRWEADQVARFEEGKDHGLPREHPKVTGQGYWRPRFNY